MTILSINDLSKKYQLGAFNSGTLYRDVQTIIAKLFKKDDPNSSLYNNKIKRDKKLFNDSFLALQDINLEISKGEIIGVIGANGAGKSTLLKIISKITSPSSGTVKYNGRVASLLEVGTGFHPELTGRENIYLNGALNGLSKDKIKSIENDVINYAEIDKHIDTPVKRYSSGMYVKLGFAIAVNLDPDIFIIDEVLAVGDSKFQKKAITTIKNISESKNITILFVSHNMSSIQSLCSRVLLIDKGRLVKDDVPSKVINQYLNLNVNEKPILYKQDIDEIKNQKFIKSEVESFDINEIQISDENRNSRLSFDSNENILIKIDFNSSKFIRDFRTVVMINLSNGQNILSTTQAEDTRMKNFNHLEKGKYTFECMLPNSIFGENDYYISIRLIDQDNYYLFLDNIFKININFKFFSNEIYLTDHDAPIKLKCKWNAYD